MEAKFVLHRIARRQDMIPFVRVVYAKRRIANFVFVLVYWALFAYYSNSYYWSVYHTLILLLCVLFSLYAVFFPRIMGWRVWCGRNKKAAESVLKFCDDCVRISGNLDEGTMQYDVFLRLVESDKHFFLFIQKYSAQVLPKDQFIQGSPAEFGVFITEKTGLPIKRVRG